MSDFRTPLSRVKGLGSAKEGTTHFWHQRLTALLLIPLVLWFGFSLAALPVAHGTLLSWVQQPWVTVALVLLISAAFYHAQLGLQVVIEDYVHGAAKVVVLIASQFGHVILVVAGVYSIVMVSIGAARISRALVVGMPAAVQEILSLMKPYPG